MKLKSIAGAAVSLAVVGVLCAPLAALADDSPEVASSPDIAAVAPTETSPSTSTPVVESSDSPVATESTTSVDQPAPEASSVASSPATEQKADLASATVQSPTTYIIALWSYDTEGVKFPQTLVTSAVTTSTDVHALDASGTKCGTTYQSDLYAYDRVTNALIASGHLNGGDESWTGGSYQDSFSNTFTTAACPVPTVQQCTAFGTVTYTATDENGTLPATINTSDTRSAGHNEIKNNALHSWTTEATSLGKAAGYFATPGLTLGNIGTPVINYVASTGVKPGFQIVLASGRILVGEPSSYGDRFWSKTAQAGVPAADGYPASANLNTWFAALGNVAVPYEGYSVGSGVIGDSVISSLSNGSGCNIVFADYVAPPVVTPPADEPPVVVPPVVQPPVELATVPVVPAAHNLAYTGTDTLGILVAGGSATALLLAGIALVLRKRQQRV